jgi:phosphate transport system permease protein
VAQKRPFRKQLWLDSIARAIITAGGIGTLLVALLIVVVMVSQLLPLLSSSEVLTVAQFELESQDDTAGESAEGTEQIASGTTRRPTNQPLCAGLDEYGDIAWFLLSSGRIDTYATATGEKLQSFLPHDTDSDTTDKENADPFHITAWSVADDDASLLVGYSNGEVRPITITWNLEYLDKPANSVGTPKVSNAAVQTELANGLIRIQKIETIEFHPPVSALQKPVRCIDWLTPAAIYGLEKAKSWKWLASDGQEIIVQHHLRRRLGISPSTAEEIRTWRFTLEANNLKTAMLNAQGEGVTTLDQNGLAQFWRLSSDLTAKRIASHWSITGSDGKVSTAAPMLGRNTLVVGSESGYIEGIATYFGATEADLVSIHHIPIGSMPVMEVASATTSRVVSVLGSDGTVHFVYVPTNRKLTAWHVQPESRLFFSAGSRFIFSVANESVRIGRLNLRFPEAGIQSYLGANWYEGYNRPNHLWQSSSGTVQGEIKLSVVPLLFGTIKGTFYTLLIAIPLGLLSAIFSSEYLHSTTRNRIKPIMELMASVPSVALGFVGAVALAPLVRGQIFHFFFFLLLTILVLVCLPTVISGLSRRYYLITIRFRGLLLSLVLGLALVVSNLIGPFWESVLFGGPLLLWLSGEFGGEFPGWLCIFLIPSGIATFFLSNHFQWDRGWLNRLWPTSLPPALHSVGFLGCKLLLSIALAIVLSSIISWVGWDVRGTLLGSYHERNALLVGIVLGFSIVPLIFTLSEDALQSVPQHLRAASMSCGATVWQTTVSVVIPTAMSGLFSAIMLGMGRAIGESMVVLMVSGNTPIIEWNPFSGLRSLAATLATELPEAARGSTHYHSLFFVALILFVFTVIVNSLAEWVRLKFRKNASQL